MAQSNTELESMKAQLIKFLPHLTCYKCKNFPSAECPKRRIFRCLNPLNGHLICEECEKPCPCGYNVSINACSLVSNLVDTLPFCCKNRDNGCQEILFQEEMKAHLSRCIFENVTCISVDEFQQEMPLKDFFDHIVLPDCSTRSEIENKVEIKVDYEKYHWLPSLVQKNPLNKPVFYFYCEVDDNILFAWIYFVGFKEDAERYIYSLEINKNSKHHMKFISPVKSIFESNDDIIAERDAFMIGRPIAKKLCEEQEKLGFYIEICDKKAEVKDEDNDSAMSDD